MPHDFSAEDVRVLRENRRRSVPFKLVLPALASFANIGAVWPVLTILVMAIGTRDMVLTAYGNTVYLGGFGIFLIALVGAATMLLSALLHRVLRPMIHAPELGPSLDAAGDFVIELGLLRERLESHEKVTQLA